MLEDILTKQEHFLENSEKNRNISTSTGRIILGVTGSLALGVTLICSSFLSPALRKYCLPYIPATNVQIQNVIQALRGRAGKLLDLGSGDGRIVIETAKLNFISHGVELNSWLVLYAKFASWKANLSGKARFFRNDLWKFDVSSYDNVVIFGVEQMMEKLEEKLWLECKNGCRIIACRFPLPGKTPVCTIGCGVDTVWVYEITKN